MVFMWETTLKTICVFFFFLFLLYCTSSNTFLSCRIVSFIITLAFSQVVFPSFLSLSLVLPYSASSSSIPQTPTLSSRAPPSSTATWHARARSVMCRACSRCLWPTTNTADGRWGTWPVATSWGPPGTSWCVQPRCPPTLSSGLYTSPHDHR